MFQYRYRLHWILLLLISTGAVSVDSSDPDPNDGLVLTRAHYQALSELCHMAKYHIRDMDNGVLAEYEDPVLLHLAQFVVFEKADGGRHLVALLEDDFYEAINELENEKRVDVLHMFILYLNVNDEIKSNIFEKCERAIVDDLLKQTSSTMTIMEYVATGSRLQQRSILLKVLTENIDIDSSVVGAVLGAVRADLFPELLSEFVLSRHRHSVPVDWPLVGNAISAFLRFTPDASCCPFDVLISKLQHRVDRYNLLRNRDDYEKTASLLIVTLIYACLYPEYHRFGQNAFSRLMKVILNSGLDNVRAEILSDSIPHLQYLARATMRVSSFLNDDLFDTIASPRIRSLPEIQRSQLASIMAMLLSEASVFFRHNLYAIGQLLHLNVPNTLAGASDVTFFDIALQLHQYSVSQSASSWWSKPDTVEICYQIVRWMPLWNIEFVLIGERHVFCEFLRLPLDLSSFELRVFLQTRILDISIRHRQQVLQILWEQHFLKASDPSVRSALADLFHVVVQYDPSSYESFAKTMTRLLLQWSSEPGLDRIPSFSYPIVFDCLRLVTGNGIVHGREHDQCTPVMMLLRLSLDLSDRTQRDLVRLMIERTARCRLRQKAPNGDSLFSLLWRQWLFADVALNDWFVETFGLLKRQHVLVSGFELVVQDCFINWTVSSPSEWFPAKLLPTVFDWIRDMRGLLYRGLVPIALLRMPLDLSQPSHRSIVEYTLRHGRNFVDKHNGDSVLSLLYRYSLDSGDLHREWFDRMFELIAREMGKSKFDAAMRETISRYGKHRIPPQTQSNVSKRLSVSQWVVLGWLAAVVIVFIVLEKRRRRNWQLQHEDDRDAE